MVVQDMLLKKISTTILDLIEYSNMLFVAARQKERATSSVTELVEAVKRPRALSESANRPVFRKSGGGREEGEERVEVIARRNSESFAPPRRNSLGGGPRISMQRISELPEKKEKKSGRRSLMGYNLLL